MADNSKLSADNSIINMLSHLMVPSFPENATTGASRAEPPVASTTTSPRPTAPASPSRGQPVQPWQPTAKDKLPKPAVAKYGLTDKILVDMDLANLPITSHPTGTSPDEIAVAAEQQASVAKLKAELMATRANACQGMAAQAAQQRETDQAVKDKVKGKEVPLETTSAQRPMTPPNTGMPPPQLFTSGVRVYSREWDALPANRRYGRFACGCITPRATSIRTYRERRPRKRKHRKYFGPTHSGTCQPAHDEVAVANIMRLMRESHPGMIRG